MGKDYRKEPKHFGEVQRQIIFLIFDVAERGGKDCIQTGFKDGSPCVKIRASHVSELENILWAHLEQPHNRHGKPLLTESDRRANGYPGKKGFAPEWARLLGNFVWHASDFTSGKSLLPYSEGIDICFQDRRVKGALPPDTPSYWSTFAQTFVNVIVKSRNEKRAGNRTKFRSVSEVNVPISTTYIPHNIPRSGLLPGQFVGRSEKLNELAELLEQDESMTAIVASGGYGKTELAIQYLKKFKDKFPGGICWIYARRIDSEFSSVDEGYIELEIIRFAERNLHLDVAGRENKTIKPIDYVFENWNCGKTLLVFDDLESNNEFSVIQRVIPKDRGFNVLITSRFYPGSPFRGIDLDVLSINDSIALVTSFIGMKRVEQEKEAVHELVEEVGQLPLALELVSRRLQIDISKRIDEVLIELKEARSSGRIDTFIEFERGTEAISMTAKRGLAEALELSWQTLSDETKDVACAIVLLGNKTFNWWQVKEVVAFNRMTAHIPSHSISNARSELVKNNLLKPIGSDNYKLHSLIVDFFMCKRENLRDWNIEDMRFITSKIPFIGRDSHKENEHWVIVVEQGLQFHRESFETETLIAGSLALFHFYESKGAFNSAFSRSQEVVGLLESVFEQDVLTDPCNLIFLASLYRRMHRHKDAEQLIRRAFAICVQQLKQEHPDVIHFLNNLAILFRLEHQYEDAEKVFWLTLSISEQVLGPEHLDTATCLNNLASLYQATHRYREAELLYRRAFEIYKHQLGLEDQATLTCLNNLASLYRATHHYNKAEQIILQLVEISEQRGTGNRDTGVCLNNLASLYQEIHQYDQAKITYLRALTIYEQQLGPEHLDTATCLRNIAGLYQAMHQYEDAESFYRRALRIYEQHFGSEHEDTIRCLNGLRGVCTAIKKT